MTHHKSFSLIPMGDAEPPHFELFSNGIPVMHLDPAKTVTVSLGNHDDPAAYFRLLAGRAERFALKIEDERARQARLAERSA